MSGLTFKNLLGQKVQDVPVAAGEGLDEAGDVFAVPHRERNGYKAYLSSLHDLFQLVTSSADRSSPITSLRKPRPPPE